MLSGIEAYLVESPLDSARDDVLSNRLGKLYDNHNKFNFGLPKLCVFRINFNQIIWYCINAVLPYLYYIRKKSILEQL